MSRRRRGGRLLCEFFGRGQVRFSVNMPTLTGPSWRTCGCTSTCLAAGHAPRPDEPGDAEQRRVIYRGEVAHKKTRTAHRRVRRRADGIGPRGACQPGQRDGPARERGIIIEERAAERPATSAPWSRPRSRPSARRTSPPGPCSQAIPGPRPTGIYLLDAHIDGTLMIFTHRDRPGLIGFIGRTLGDEGVNIGEMNVGREEQGGEAIGVVNLDGAPAQGPRGRPGTPRS